MANLDKTVKNGDINGTVNGKHGETDHVEVQSIGGEKKPRSKSYVEQVKKNFQSPTKSSSVKTKDGPKEVPKPVPEIKSKPKTKAAPKPPSPSPKSKEQAPFINEKSKVAPKLPDKTDVKAVSTPEVTAVATKGETAVATRGDRSVATKSDTTVATKGETRGATGQNKSLKSPEQNKTSEQKPESSKLKKLAPKPPVKEEKEPEKPEELSFLSRALGIIDSNRIQENHTVLDCVPMATSADHDEGQESNQLEYIYVTDNKLKYMNKDFEKVNAQMYDYKCDVKLKVADENYKAHREVLSNASDYFAAMFSHDMKEKDQEVIELKEISPKGFSAMMDYFYHGHVTLDPDNIEDVIEAARFFHNDWLLECCCDFLIRHLSLENYTAVITLADKYYLGDLRWDIFRFIGENLANLTQQEKFYPNLSLELLLQFLMENIYIEASERFVLDLIVNWVRANPTERKEHLLSLLRQIRFPLMEIEELETLPEEVFESTEIKDAVEDALNYNLNLMGQCLKKGEVYLQRGARTVVVILSFSDEGNLLVYRDLVKNGFFVEQLGPAGLETVDYQALAQAKLGNFLYAAGGYDDTYSSTNRVFRFDPRYRDWTEVASMNQPRVSFSMCSSDTQLFVVAGVNRVEEDETILDSVEVYTAEDNSWTTLQPLPMKCCDSAVTFANNCLWVTGGISIDPEDQIPLTNTWCLDLSTNSGWVPKQNLITGRQGHSMIPFNGKIYAIGGYTSKDGLMTFKDCLTNEVYDIETNQWTEIAPTPEEFGHLYRHNDIIEGRVYCIGSSNVVANLYTYDIETDTWEECDSIGPNVQKLAILDVAYPYS